MCIFKLSAVCNSPEEGRSFINNHPVAQRYFKSVNWETLKFKIVLACLKVSENQLIY